MDHLDLVQQALGGHREALDQLAEVSYSPLRSYVLRITFNNEIADDIVQDTLLEMYRIFAQLRQAENFWPWLCKIALNKVRKYSVIQSRHRELLKMHAEQNGGKDDMDGLAAAINQEFQRAILDALSYLSDRQKAVLSLRCYENMSYSQIAEVMDVSELGCRLLAARARKKLQNKLYSLGYGRKALLAALVLFGKLTAPSKSAAAQIAMSPSTLGVGATAAGIALVTSKAALVTLAVLGIAGGGYAVKQLEAQGTEENKIVQNVPQSPGSNPDAPHLHDCFYFFPQGKAGPVITRFTVHEGGRVMNVLQNDTGSYLYDPQQRCASVRNDHYWNADLSVMTLPTDSPQLESFLAHIENRAPDYKKITSDSLRLFIMLNDEHPPRFFGASNYNALMEERFQYHWPAGTGVLDQRDEVHRQGRCRVQVEGTLYGKAVTGEGELPFTYGKATQRPAWIKIRVQDRFTLTDTPSGAAVIDSAGELIASYPTGTFLFGANRPWSGLHVIDTVRRDAASLGIPFETVMEAAGTAGKVCLQLAEGQIEYCIQMNNDWIETIVFTCADGTRVGELHFAYRAVDAFQTDDLATARFGDDFGSSQSIGVHWLAMLLKEQWR